MGQYPAGALKSAIDCFMRQPGVLESSRVKFDFQATGQGGSGPQVSAEIIPSDVLMLQLFNAAGVGYWEWFDASTFNAAAMTGFAWPVDGTCTWTRSRNRFVANALQGLQTFDYTSPTTLAQRTPRMTGLPAVALSAVITGGAGSALPPNTHATCIAIVRRTYPDGYQVVSATSFPSDSTSFTGGTITTDLQYTVLWFQVPDNPFLAGDVIEIYRTRLQANPTANGIGATSCDSTYYMTTTHTITSADISASFARFNDSIPDTGFGKELYTNLGIGGGYATRLSPPLAKCLTTFKGYTFAFNITEAAQIVLSVLGGIGVADTTITTASPAWRQNLIGARTLVGGGTATIGSPVITGVAAADLVGLRIGQQLIFDPHWVSGSPSITAIGATTITVSLTAGSSGAVTGAFYDVLLINGAIYSYQGQLSLTAAQEEIPVQMSGGISASNLTMQAASLAYFSSTHVNAPTATTFSIATLRAGLAPTTFTISATNGQSYQPALPEYTATPLLISPVAATNGYAWTEEQEPDGWSVANRGRIGSSDIVAAAPTRDALWIFTLRNGLWRLYGNGGAVGAEGFDWSVDPVDSTISIAGPQAWDVLRDTVYAYTNRGLVAISDNGIDDTLSQGVINDLLPGPFYSTQNLIQVVADEENDEIWVYDGTHAYVWSFLAKAWVQNTQLAPSVPNGSYATTFWQQIKSVVIVEDAAARARYFNPAFDSFVQMSWDYQPLYFEDPFATKQWVDTTWVFTNEFAEKFIPYVQTIVRFNGQSYFGNVAPVSNGADARVTYMVPRNSPAIANAICPGILVFGSLSNTPPRFEGLSMRATIIGEQQTRRNT